MRQARLGLVLAVLSFSVACGDDDAAKNKADGGAAGDGSQSADGGPMLRPNGGKGGGGGSSGNTTSGWLPEGSPCDPNNVCAEGLTCMSAGLPNGLPQLDICARKCTDATQATDCTEKEECYMVGSAGYCVSPIKTAFSDCGPLNTSYCVPPLECRYFNQDDPMTPAKEFAAACLLPCTPETDADGGLGEAECGTGKTCLPDLEACATLVGLGEECGVGDKLCDEGLRCLGSSSSGKAQCYQRCDDAGSVCKQGECTEIPSSSASGTPVKACI